MTLLQRARNLYSSGMLEQALQVAHGGLALEPQYEAQLCEVAAAAAHALGDVAQSEGYWRRAIARDPRSGAMQHGFGLLLASSGRETEAEPYFRRATELTPRFADAHFCLGRCLAGRGQPAAAEQCFRKALSLNPKLAPAHLFLGLALFKTHQIADAEKCLRRAIALDAGMAEAFSHLGVLLSQSGRETEGEACLRRAIELGPGYAFAYLNLGTLLAGLRRDAEAEQCYRQAITLDSGFVDAFFNLGNLLHRIQREEEAEACYRRTIELDENHVDACINLGSLLVKVARYADAETMLRRAVALDARCEGVLSTASYAASYACSWKNFEADTKRIGALLARGDASIASPFALHAMPGLAPLDLKAAGHKFAEEHVKSDVPRERNARATGRPDRDRIRIGYLSAHFHSHAVAFALAGVLDAHDAAQFTVAAYSYGPDALDEGRQRVRAACSPFRDVRPLTDAAAAHQIASDGIDILVDLVGYTSDCRPAISALRPAPVLVNWLGYPGTLGHPRMADYIVGDPVVTPVAHAGYFSETLALMPYCYLPYDRGRSVAARPSRQSAGLPEDGFVFCGFCQSYKLNPPMFDIWCRLLLEIPRSVLWLQMPGDDAAANLGREAASRGVDPARLVFARRVESVSEYLGRLQLADLALDTYPYTSHSTGSDLLWAGVPLVTTMGETFASRVAASQLHAAGMPDLVAANPEEYFTMARQLARDPAALQDLRRRLAEKRSGSHLFNTTQFTRDLERLYEAMWRQHLAGAKQPIVLAPEGMQC